MAGNVPSTNDKNRSGRGAVRLVLWPTLLLFIGLFVLFLAERMFNKELHQRLLDGVAALLLIAGLVGHAGRRSAAQSASERKAYGILSLSGLAMLLGVGLYLLFSAKSVGIAEPLRNTLGKSFERISGLATVLWPALVLAGSLTAAFVQQALHGMTDDSGHTEQVDPLRIRYSAQSGLSISLVVIFVAAVQYTSAENNKKVDFSRFRTSRPSEATKKVVQNLSRNLRVTIFYPSANEVRETVVPYFEELGKESSKLQVEVLDHALEPQRARELSATGNGLVIIAQLDDKGAPSQRETLNIGTTTELAQGMLATLDTEVQKRLLTLTRPGRIAYFTTGHGERNFDMGAPFDVNKEDLRAPVGALRQILMSLGYEVRTLSVANGLGHKVPADAGLVVIAGATDAPLPEEVSALLAYLNDGGHVYLLLDPTATAANGALGPILKSVGVKYHSELLAHDELFAQRTRKAADKNNVLGTGFSSHVSVTMLSRAAGRVGVVLPRTGWFERDGQPPAGVQLDLPIRTAPDTYADTNGSFSFDSTEKKQVFDVAVVAQKAVGEPPKDAKEAKDSKNKRELRLAVLGSVDAVSDLGLSVRTNGALVQDTVKWLTQEEALVGEVAQEQDVPIVHTKEQDKLWFWSTILAAPALVLTIGLLYVRAVRRRRVS
ncbi:MAG: Gldg family protein [Polyangia bacterium]